jgi:hypothetical protein
LSFLIISFRDATGNFMHSILGREVSGFTQLNKWLTHQMFNLLILWTFCFSPQRFYIIF